MGFQLKRTFCSKSFATGPSELGNVVCQMENQTESRKYQGDHILQVHTRQVKCLGITFDSQVTFKKHFEDILDGCNTRYHRLRLLANKKCGPSPSSLIQIYKKCVRPVFECGSLSTITSRTISSAKFDCSKTSYSACPFFTKIHLSQAAPLLLWPSICEG